MPNRSDHPHGMKLVILGRDGTINRYRDDHVKSPEELEPLPGALEAVARLNHAGWHTVMATNQPGIGRGLLDMASLNAVHLRLNQLLAEKGGRLDAAFFCPHAPEENCNCRKPLPGMLLDIGKRYSVDLEDVPSVGDSVKDLLASAAAGCEPHLLRHTRGGRRGDAELDALRAQVPAMQVHEDLMAFADFIVRRERQAKGLSAAADSEHGAFN